MGAWVRADLGDVRMLYKARFSCLLAPWMGVECGSDEKREASELPEDRFAEGSYSMGFCGWCSAELLRCFGLGLDFAAAGAEEVSRGHTSPLAPQLPAATLLTLVVQLKHNANIGCTATVAAKLVAPTIGTLPAMVTLGANMYQRGVIFVRVGVYSVG